MACKITSIFPSILILPFLLFMSSCDAANAPCPTILAPHPTCKSPQACANQCAAAGYLIGYCEVYDGEFGDCVCVKCPNAVQAGRPAAAPAPAPAVRG